MRASVPFENESNENDWKKVLTNKKHISKSTIIIKLELFCINACTPQIKKNLQFKETNFWLRIKQKGEMENWRKFDFRLGLLSQENF